MMDRSLPDSIDTWLAMEGDWVEEPNVRRDGQSGVMLLTLPHGKKLYRKQQLGHTFRSWRYPLGYPTAMREYEALCDCLSMGVQVPKPVFADCRRVESGWQSVLVTESLEGFVSVEDCYAKGLFTQWGDAIHRKAYHAMGQALATLNTHKRQHGCLRTKHVFIRMQGEQIQVAFLDMEKSRKRFLIKQAIAHDVTQFGRRLIENTIEDTKVWDDFVLGYESVLGYSLGRLRRHRPLTR